GTSPHIASTRASALTAADRAASSVPSRVLRSPGPGTSQYSAHSATGPSTRNLIPPLLKRHRSIERHRLPLVQTAGSAVRHCPRRPESLRPLEWEPYRREYGRGRGKGALSAPAAPRSRPGTPARRTLGRRMLH